MARSEFIIEDGVRLLRQLRKRFVSEATMKIHENSSRLIDRLWIIRAAQLDPDRMTNGLYEIDPNAPDQEKEKRKRRDSALLAKLATPIWETEIGIVRTEPYDREQRIDELDRNLRTLANTGLYPHEQWTGVTERPISAETLRYNQSLRPEQREKMFRNGLQLPVIRTRARGRKRIHAIDPLQAFSETPFARGRKQWRASDVFYVCEALYRVASWIEENPDDNLVATYARRYRLDDLFVSQSQNAPDSFEAKLAIAIASADNIASGTDDYEPNDLIANHAFVYYGFYLQALKRSKKSPSRENVFSSFCKLLNL
ncbi:MAG: hypothetical protein PBV01_09350 [Brucella anthropi]